MAETPEDILQNPFGTQDLGAVDQEQADLFAQATEAGTQPEPEQVPQEEGFKSWSDYKSDPDFGKLDQGQKQQLFDQWKQYSIGHLSKIRALDTENDARVADETFNKIAKEESLQQTRIGEPSYVAQIMEQGQSGLNSMESGVVGYGAAIGAADPTRAAEIIAANNLRTQNMFVSPEMREYGEKAKTAGDVVRYMFGDIKNVMMPVFAQSIGSNVPAIAASLATSVGVGALTTPAGGAAAGLITSAGLGGITDTVVSFNERVAEEVKKRGLNPLSSADIETVLRDPEFKTEAATYAEARGVAITATELATLGMGKILNAPAKAIGKVAFKEVAKEFAKDTALQVLTEPAGEALAQVAGQVSTGQEIKLSGKDIAEEALAGLPSNAFQGALMTVLNLTDNRAPMTASEVTREGVENLANKRYEQILKEGSTEQSLETYYNVLSTADKAKTLGVAPEAPLTNEQGTYSGLSAEEKAKVKAEFEANKLAVTGEVTPTVQEAEAGVAEAFTPPVAPETKPTQVSPEAKLELDKSAPGTAEVVKETESKVPVAPKIEEAPKDKAGIVRNIQAPKTSQVSLALSQAQKSLSRLVARAVKGMMQMDLHPDTYGRIANLIVSNNPTLNVAGITKAVTDFLTANNIPTSPTSSFSGKSVTPEARQGLVNQYVQAGYTQQEAEDAVKYFEGDFYDKQNQIESQIFSVIDQQEQQVAQGKPAAKPAVAPAPALPIAGVPPVAPTKTRLAPTKKQTESLGKLGYLPADIEGLDRTQAKDIIAKKIEKEKAKGLQAQAPALGLPGTTPPRPALGEAGKPVAPATVKPSAEQAEQKRLDAAEQVLKKRLGAVLAEGGQFTVDEESLREYLGPNPTEQDILRARATIRLLNLALADVKRNIMENGKGLGRKVTELELMLNKIKFTKEQVGSGLATNPRDVRNLDVLFVNPERLISRLQKGLTASPADFFVQVVGEEAMHAEHGNAAFNLFVKMTPEGEATDENYVKFYDAQNEEIEQSLSLNDIVKTLNGYSAIDTRGKTKQQLIDEFNQRYGRKGRLAEEYVRALIQKKLLNYTTEEAVTGTVTSPVMRTLGMIKDWLSEYVGNGTLRKEQKTIIDKYYDAVTNTIYDNPMRKVREARDEKNTVIPGNEVLTASTDPRKRIEARLQVNRTADLVKQVNDDFLMLDPQGNHTGPIWLKSIGGLIRAFPTMKPRDIESIVSIPITKAIGTFDGTRGTTLSTHLFTAGRSAILKEKEKIFKERVARGEIPEAAPKRTKTELEQKVAKQESKEEAEFNAEQEKADQEEADAPVETKEEVTSEMSDTETQDSRANEETVNEQVDAEYAKVGELLEEDQEGVEALGPTRGGVPPIEAVPSEYLPVEAGLQRVDVQKVNEEIKVALNPAEQAALDLFSSLSPKEKVSVRNRAIKAFEKEFGPYEPTLATALKKMRLGYEARGLTSADLARTASVDPVELAKQRGIKTEITKLSDLYNFPARFTNTQEMEANGVEVEKFASAMSKIQKLGIVPDPTILNFLQAYENKIDWNKIKNFQDLYAYAEKTYADISEIQNYRVSPKDINFSLEENALAALAVFNEDARKALEAYRQNKEQNQLKILDYINKQRIESVQEWYSEIDNVTDKRDGVMGYNLPFAKILLWSIPDTALKAKRAGGSTIAVVPSLVQTVLNKMNENGLKTINIEKLYRKMLTDMAAQNVVEKVEVAPGKEWVYIPSKPEDPINFKSNVEKLKQLSASSWCTKTFNAEPYLQRGGFWILIDNQKPSIAVRKEGSGVREIQDIQNLGIKPIPDDLWNDTVSFLKKRDLYSSAVPIIRQAGRLSGDDLLKVISTAKNITELEAYLRDYQLSSIASPETGTMIWNKTKELIQKEKDQYASSQGVTKTLEYVEDLYAPKVGDIVRKLIIPPSADKQFVLPNSEVATDIFNYLLYLQGVRQEFKTERPTTFKESPTFIYDFEATPVFSPEQKRALARGYLFGNEDSYDDQFSESSFLPTEDLNELVRHINDQDLGFVTKHYRFKPILGNTNSNLDTLKFILDSNPSYNDPDNAGLKIELYVEAMTKSRTAAPYAFLGGKGLTTERKDYEKHLVGLTSLIANDFDAMSTKSFYDLMLYLEDNRMDLLINSIIYATPPGQTNDVLESVLQKLLDNDIDQKQIYKFFANFPQDESGVIKRTIEKVANNIMGRNELTIYTIEKLAKIFSLYSSWYNRSQDLVSQQTAKDILSTFASYLRSEEVSRNGVERIFESAILPWKTLQEKALQGQTKASPLFLGDAKEFDQRNAIYNSLSASKTFKELLNIFDEDFKSTASEKMDILSFLPTRSLGDPDIVDKLLSYGSTVLKEKKESGAVGSDGNIDALLFEANSLVRRTRREQKPFDRIKHKDLVDKSIILLTDYAKFLAPKVEKLIATKGVPRLYANTEDIFDYGVEGYLRAVNLAFDIIFSDTITQKQREELTEVIGRFPPIAARQFLDSMAVISFWKQDALNTFEDVQRAFKKTSGKNMGELLNEFFDTNYGKTMLSVSESGKQKSFPNLQILLGENSEQKTKALEALIRYSTNVYSKFLTPGYLRDINLSAELSFSAQGLEAFYDPSQAELVFVLDNILSRQRGRQLFFHEATHGNVAYLRTNEQGQNELNQILNSARNELMENAEYLANRTGFTSFDEMKVAYGFKNDTEMLGELLARYAEDLETRIEPSWFTKIIRDLIGWFKRNLGLDFNREDLLNWLADRMQSAAQGERLVADTQEPTPVLPSLTKGAFTASVDPVERLQSQALRRAILGLDELFPEVAKLLRTRTYTPIENAATMNEANNFVDTWAIDGNPMTAKRKMDAMLRENPKAFSIPQRNGILVAVGTRLDKATKALDSQIKKEGNSPEKAALRLKLGEDYYEVFTEGQEINSESGQSLQSGNLWSALATPEVAVKTYTKPITDQQKAALENNAEVKKLKAEIEALKSELEKQAVDKAIEKVPAPKGVRNVYDFLSAFGDLEPLDGENFQDYLNRIGVPYEDLMSALETNITASVDPVNKTSPVPANIKSMPANEAIATLLGLDKNLFGKLVGIRLKTGRVATTAQIAQAQQAKRNSPKARAKQAEMLQTVFDFFNSTESEKPATEQPIEKDTLPVMVRLAKYSADAVTARILSSLGFEKGKTPKSVFDRIELQVRKVVNDQFRNETNPQNVTADDVRTTEERMLAIVERLTLAEDIFNQTKAQLRLALERDNRLRQAKAEGQLNDVERKALEDAIAKTFDANKIRSTESLVKSIVDFRAEARKSMSMRGATVRSLTKTILDKIPKITDQQAESLAKLIAANYQQLVKASGEKQLARLLTKVETKGKAVPKSEQTKMLELINLGAFDNEEFYNILAERYNLPTWNPEVVAEIKKRAEEQQALPEGSDQRLTKGLELQAYIVQQILKSDKDKRVNRYRANVVSSLWKAGALSGPGTQIVNFYGTNLNVALELFSEAVGYYMSLPPEAKKNTNPVVFLSDAFGQFFGAMGKGGDQAFDALNTGFARFRSETQKGTPILEAFKVDINKPWKASNYVALWKLVGRSMAASDTFNSVLANEAKLKMQVRYTLLKSGLSEEETSAKVNDLFNAEGSANVRAQAQVDEEANAGQFGTLDGITPGTNEYRVAKRKIDAGKRRRFEQLRELEINKEVDLSEETADGGRDSSDPFRGIRHFTAVATFNNQPTGFIGFIVEKIASMSAQVPLLTPFGSFTRTVGNIVNSGLNYTPYGFLRANGFSIGNTFLYDTKYNFDKPDAKGYYKLATQASLGTAVMVAVAALVFDSIDDPWDEAMFAVTGLGPTNKAKRDQLRASGWAPNTVRFKGPFGPVQFRHSDIPGFSLIFGAMGMMSDSIRYGTLSTEDKMQLAAYTVMSMGNVVFEKNLLSGTKSLFDILSLKEDPTKFLTRAAQAYTGGLANPGIFRWAGNTFRVNENGMVTQIDYKNLTSSFWGNLMALTPIAVVAGKPMLNRLGEKVEEYPWAATTKRVGFVPEVKVHPVFAPLNGAGLFVPGISNLTKVKVFENGKLEQRRMTGDEYYDYAKFNGEYLKRVLTPARAESLATLAKANKEAAQDQLESLAIASKSYALNRIEAQIRLNRKR